MARVKKASREVAHWYPSFSYIWLPNRGNAADAQRQYSIAARDCRFHSPAKVQRTKAFAASALAAYCGYASTCFLLSVSCHSV